MSAQHTPGPWVISYPSRRSRPHIRTPDGIYVMDGGSGSSRPSVRQLADARLIAAAPELLEALQMLLEFPNTGPATSAARAALAKATGEQP